MARGHGGRFDLWGRVGTGCTVSVSYLASGLSLGVSDHFLIVIDYGELAICLRRGKGYHIASLPWEQVAGSRVGG